MRRTAKNRSHSNRRRKDDDDPSSIRSSDYVSLLRRRLGHPEHDPPTPGELRLLEQELIYGEPEARQKARETLINKNLRRVFEVAGEEARGNTDLLVDYFHEGVLGVHEAMERWKPEKGAKFSTYADYFIRGRICRWKREFGNLCSLPYEDTSVPETSVANTPDNDITHEKNTPAGTGGNDSKEKPKKKPKPLLRPIQVELNEEIITYVHATSPEGEIATLQVTLEFMEVRDQLLECLEQHVLQIRNVRVNTPKLKTLFLRVFGSDLQTISAAS